MLSEERKTEIRKLVEEGIELVKGSHKIQNDRYPREHTVFTVSFNGEEVLDQEEICFVNALVENKKCEDQNKKIQMGFQVVAVDSKTTKTTVFEEEGHPEEIARKVEVLRCRTPKRGFHLRNSESKKSGKEQIYKNLKEVAKDVRIWLRQKPYPDIS